jgi:hypothetical protein
MFRRTLLLAFSIVVASALNFNSHGSSQQRAAAKFSNNQCVNCHAKSSLPANISSRYLDWHFSAHKTNGVGCDRCHGGDATTRDPQRAHKGVTPSSQQESRLSLANLPETCGACHKAVVNSFVESVHYEKLKSSGLGPSCNTCHSHMASSVATFPTDAATYCTLCHNSISGILPQRPDIPAKAKKVMESIGRATYAVRFAQDLLKDAQHRKLDVTKQIEDMRLLQILLHESKVGWHAFTLEGARVKAEKAFEESLRLRDLLMRKLGRA